MSQLTVRNPDFEAVVRGSFAQQGLMSRLGASIRSVAPGAVEVAVGFRDELTQQQGFFHGCLLYTSRCV